MTRTTAGLAIQMNYGTDPEVSEALAAAMSSAWADGWAACDRANCANCYSCGAWIGDQVNPYRVVVDDE